MIFLDSPVKHVLDMIGGRGMRCWEFLVFIIPAKLVLDYDRGAEIQTIREIEQLGNTPP